MSLKEEKEKLLQELTELTKKHGLKASMDIQQSVIEKGRRIEEIDAILNSEQTETERIKDWFNQLRTDVIKISAVERAAEVPQKTLWHVIHGDRGLTDENVKKITSILQEFGFKPNN